MPQLQSAWLKEMMLLPQAQAQAEIEAQQTVRFGSGMWVQTSEQDGLSVGPLRRFSGASHQGTSRLATG